MMGIDIEREMLLPPVHGFTTYGGLSGPAVKPIGLRAVSSIYKNTDLTISGIGGIENWKNAIEYIMCGATSVQVVTDTVLNGFNQIKEWTSSMEDYLKRHNYSSLEDIKGKVVQNTSGKYLGSVPGPTSVTSELSDEALAVTRYM